MWTCGLVSAPDHVNKWLFLDSLGNHDLLMALDLAHVGFSLFGRPETWPRPWVPSLTQKPVACGEQVEKDQWGDSPTFLSEQRNSERPQGKNLIMNAAAGVHNTIPCSHLDWLPLPLSKLSNPVENDAPGLVLWSVPGHRLVTSLRQDKMGRSL